MKKNCFGEQAGSYIIENDGVVFGAKYDSNFNVVHDYTNNKSDLQYFRHSKYVRSDLNDSYTAGSITEGEYAKETELTRAAINEYNRDVRSLRKEIQKLHSQVQTEQVIVYQ